MKLAQIIKSKFKDQSGVTAVVAAVSMLMLLSFLALAIDVGYLYATKNELQNVADAAALAATGKLGDIYTTVDPSTYVCDRTTIVASAQAVVGSGKNSAGGKDIIIRDEDIYIDNREDVKEDFPKYRFNTNDLNQPDAVRIIARRQAGVNSRINTFFAGVFGIDFLPVWADATAALTGTSQVVEEGLPLPIGVSEDFFVDDWCNTPLVFHPTTESCAGWHSYDLGPGDDYKQIKKLLESVRDDYAVPNDDMFISPLTDNTSVYNFNGGTAVSSYAILDEIFQDRKGCPEETPGCSESEEIWDTTVVVYAGPCYDNPNDAKQIVGFANIRITGICFNDYDGFVFPRIDGPYTCEASEPQIVGYLTCGSFEGGRGGGGEFGIMGTIPGLIE